MFIKGMLFGFSVGSFITLIIYSCIIVGKFADENIYKNIQ